MVRNVIYCLFFVLGFLLVSCQNSVRETKIEIPLNAAWEYRPMGSKLWMPAHVPGSVSLETEENKKAGRIPGSHANLYRFGCEYRTQFDVSSEILEQDVVQLCFNGIGPYANVYLNDSLVLKANNSFRSWVVNCKSILRAKGNKLVIVLHQKHKGRKDSLAHCTRTEHKVTPGGTDGGENNPRTVFCSHTKPGLGILKPVILKAWSTANIEDIYLKPDSVSSRKAIYRVAVSIQSTSNQVVNLELLLNNKSVLISRDIKLNRGANIYHTQIVIDRPKLWFTNGLGTPNLYNITLRLKREQEIISEAHQLLGVRTLELVKQTKASDQSFFFKLNGIPIFVRGATLNACCNTNMSPDQVKQMIDNARESNFNMIRVSGAYGDDSFYDACDENGILVWQDFSSNLSGTMADSTLHESYQQEAIENMKRLRNHPSLAMWWCNDLPSCLHSSHSGENHSKKAISTTILQEKLPDLVARYGFPTAYNCASPYADSKPSPSIVLLNGTMLGSIVSGYSVPSYNRFRGNQHLPDNVFQFNAQQHDDADNQSLSAFIQKNFNMPGNMESQAYVSWIAQSELLKTAIENHRVRMPECMGTIFDGLNDCREGWSVAPIDSSMWWKPAQYAIREAFSHVLVVPVRGQNSVTIYGVSDALRDLDVFLLVRLTDFYGNSLFVKQIPVELKANSSSILLTLKESDLLKKIDVTKCCLVVQINQANKTLSQNLLYFTELKNLFQPTPVIHVDINEAAKGYNLILRSSVLVKNLVITTKTKKCWLSDNNLDLLPGKRTKVSVRYNGTKAELERELVFKSLADLK